MTTLTAADIRQAHATVAHLHAYVATLVKLDADDPADQWAGVMTDARSAAARVMDALTDLDAAHNQ